MRSRAARSGGIRVTGLGWRAGWAMGA